MSTQINKVTIGVRLIGGPSEAARKLKSSRNAVHVWMRQGYVHDDWIPAFIREVKSVAPDMTIEVDEIRKPIILESA